MTKLARQLGEPPARPTCICDRPRLYVDLDGARRDEKCGRMTADQPDQPEESQRAA